MCICIYKLAGVLNGVYMCGSGGDASILRVSGSHLLSDRSSVCGISQLGASAVDVRSAPEHLLQVRSHLFLEVYMRFRNVCQILGVFQF